MYTEITILGVICINYLITLELLRKRERNSKYFLFSYGKFSKVLTLYKKYITLQTLFKEDKKKTLFLRFK